MSVIDNLRQIVENGMGFRTFSLIVFFAGMLLAAAGTISFRFRAIANKKAWGGITLPAGLIGVFLLILGVTLLIPTL
jgi:hypothetical protein